MSMNITNNYLDEAVREPVDVGGGHIKPIYIVIHATCGASAISSIEYWRDEQSASAHIVIGRDGTIYQCRAFNVKAWHAGESEWKGHNGLNDCSIGIELANGQNLFATRFSELPPYVAENEDTWETYPDIQLEACKRLCAALSAAYPIEEIVRHSDISPGRKVDPGPAFPFEDLLQYVEAGDDQPWVVHPPLETPPVEVAPSAATKEILDAMDAIAWQVKKVQKILKNEGA